MTYSLMDSLLKKMDLEAGAYPMSFKLNDSRKDKMATKPKNFIKSAIKKPGALRATAKRAGAISKSGTIKKSFIDKAAKSPGKLGQRARLAKTLSKLRK